MNIDTTELQRETHRLILSLRDKENPAEFLYAVGAYSRVYQIVDWHGVVAELELDSVGSDTHEIGLEPPSESGLWVWEGTIRYTDPTGPSDRIVDATYTGSWRRATPEEVRRYVAGVPVWREAGERRADARDLDPVERIRAALSAVAALTDEEIAAVVGDNWPEGISLRNARAAARNSLDGLVGTLERSRT